METEEHPQRYLRIEAEQRIKAPPEEVFEALTVGLSEWMPYRERPDTPIVFETKPGGLIYEDWGKEGFRLLGTLAAYKPPQQIIIVGPDGYGEGGFSTRSIEELEPDGEGGSIHKKLLVVWGAIPEEAEKGYRDGVPGLAKLLKEFVEDGKGFDPSKQSS